MTRILVASLGGLPKNKEAVKAFGGHILELEHAFRVRPLLPPGLGREALDSLIWGLLEEVRGREGLRSSQVSGTQSKGYDFREASVLVVTGVHATRSVFVLYYKWSPATSQHGRLPDLTRWVWEEVQIAEK